MSDTDYYTIMGVARDATEKEIKHAYKRLARRYHPDVSKEPDAEEKFKTLGQAYDVLGDPKKRAAYDQYGVAGVQGQPAGSAYDAQGAQPFYSYHTGGGGFEMDEEWLSSLFGHRRSHAHAQTGAHYQATLTLTLEEAFAGGMKEIELPSDTGQLQRLKVKIPAGVTSGTQMRLKGQGGQGVHQGARGDLYLTIQVKPHALYEVKEKDIYLTLPVAPWEAALGAKIAVPTLGGAVDLKIPAGSQGGQRLRLKGRGLPGKTAGDQFVVLKLVLPPAKTAQAKHLYEQMAKEMAFNPRAQISGGA